MHLNENQVANNNYIDNEKILNKRWVIYIDLEGFGRLYEKDKLIKIALSQLMDGIFRIGECCCPDSPDRIFAYQTGDGFFIVGEFGIRSLEVPISISIALMLHIAAIGRFSKVAIGEGEVGDITGYFPDSVRNKKALNGSIPMGQGIMTIFPVMGTGFINSISIMKRSPKGSLLTLGSCNLSRLPAGCSYIKIKCSDITAINWVYSRTALVDIIQKRANLMVPSPSKIAENFKEYCKFSQPPKEWIKQTKKLFNKNYRLSIYDDKTV